MSVLLNAKDAALRREFQAGGASDDSQVTPPSIPVTRVTIRSSI
jgi:hypothetical protein